MSDLERRVMRALDEIRPFLQNDGGDIQLSHISDKGVVEITLLGACAGCSVNKMTLKNGVETTIKKHAPEIHSVVHSHG